MKKLANEAQTPVTEKTDLKAQLAEVAERIRTMREIIGLSEEEMAQRTGVTLEEYRGFSEVFDESLYEDISLAACVAKRTSEGGASPANIAAQIEYLKQVTA